jgi:hypothetical protein
VIVVRIDAGGRPVRPSALCGGRQHAAHVLERELGPLTAPPLPSSEQRLRAERIAVVTHSGCHHAALAERRGSRSEYDIQARTLRITEGSNSHTVL